MAATPSPFSLANKERLQHVGTVNWLFHIHQHVCPPSSCLHSSSYFTGLRHNVPHRVAKLLLSCQYLPLTNTLHLNHTPDPKSAHHNKTLAVNLNYESHLLETTKTSNPTHQLIVYIPNPCFGFISPVPHPMAVHKYTIFHFASHFLDNKNRTKRNDTRQVFNPHSYP